VSWHTVPTFAVGVLATLAAALIVRCRGPGRADSAATDRMMRWWAAVWLRAAGARVAIEGLEHLRAAAPCVVVSNHQSNLDPIVHLRALPLSLRVLAKRDLFRIWLFGPALRMIGMIEVDRESPDFRQIDQAAARDLAAGHSLLAYPEGTTSPDGTIGEFKDGAFVIAVASQVPIVPVAIHGTCRIWPPGRTVIHHGQGRVVAAGPLLTTGLTQHDVARLPPGLVPRRCPPGHRTREPSTALGPGAALQVRRLRARSPEPGPVTQCDDLYRNLVTPIDAPISVKSSGERLCGGARATRGVCC
jgi:1-acyl-sn-glycerol-3-phosphate acyltransferase